jgi:hypothetical protein
MKTLFFVILRIIIGRRDNSVGKATGCGAAEGSDFEFRKDQDFSLLDVVQTGSGAHPASYPMGTGSCFLEDKATWA